MNNLIDLSRSIPTLEPGLTVAYTPVTLPMAGRSPLELRLTSPAEGEGLPIVLLSHGAGPSKYIPSKDGYTPLAQFWAERGFAVIQPTHGNSKVAGLPADAPGAPFFWRSRVLDMKHILDQLDVIEDQFPAITGAKLVFPGAAMDGASLWELIDSEKPTCLAGVPTVWLGLLNHLDSINQTMESVEKVVVGGSAAPLSMIKAFDEKHGAFLLHAWGMTEMSPIGTVNAPNKRLMAMPAAERYEIQRKQGKPVFGVEMKIIDDEGRELPRDGKAYGRLMVRGPWIVNAYYKSDKVATEDGWFDTGDVANISPDNYMQIVDRSKDVIKSGAEWISSIDLENVAVGHPAVAEACVIGIPHDKWQERPLLLVVLKEGASATRDDILEFLAPQLAKFWMPDDVVFRKDLPHTATGKLLKVPLREEYASYYIQ